MGKVVNINDSAKSRRSRAKSGRPRPSKTALVLGGGGFTGGVYEIGALRALDLLAVNSTVNDFDMYVGTSAGSFIASMLACGITPEEMMRVLTDEDDAPIEVLDQDVMLRPNFPEYLKRAAWLPFHIAGMAKNMLPNFRELSAIDVGYGLAENLPLGLYSNGGIGRYMREALATKGLTDSFDALQKDLFLTATDLDSGERVVMGDGDGYWTGVPISKAVECSTALPLVYEPVELNGRNLIDGGIYSTTNVDVAVARGAKFIVVINPLVPFVNDRASDLKTVSGGDVRRIADMGVPAIANQAFRLLVHQRLHQDMDSWKEKYPGVDIVLIEPDMDDELMFGTSIMDYAHRLQIASHGFETITARLAKDYASFTEVAEKHGIEISAKRLRRVVHKVREEEPTEESMWRRLFDQTTSTLLRQSS